MRWTEGGNTFRERCLRETTKAAARMEARNFLAVWAAQRRGRSVDPGGIRLSDLERAVLADYRRQQRRCAANVTRTYAHLRDFFGDPLISEITTARLREYVDVRMQVAARGSVRLELSYLRRGYRLIAEVADVRMPKIPQVREGDPRRGFFEEAEIESVLAFLRAEVRALVGFLAYTGWRRGEALGLRWSHIDFALGIVRLDPGTTKNGDGRVFPFAQFPDLHRILVAQRRIVDALETVHGRKIPFVFVDTDGRPVHNFRKAWKTACRKAGCPDRHVHDLRRSAVRRLERAGVPRSVAMQITGHRTETVYRRYAIVCERDLVEGVRRLADHLQCLRASSLGYDVLPGPLGQTTENKGKDGETGSNPTKDFPNFPS